NAAVTAPVIGDGAAAMWDDQSQRREILEQIRHQELHEGGGVAVDVMAAGGVEDGIGSGGDVDHPGHVELDHLLIERIPPAVGERRILPVAAAWVGIEVAAD